MRRIIIACIAMMVFFYGYSQTFVDQVNWTYSMALIPPTVTADAKPRVQFYGQDYQTDEVIMMIYKENFEFEKRVEYKERAVRDIYFCEVKNDGEWTVEYADTSYFDPVAVYIYDIEKGDCFDNVSVRCTQTLFNHDDKYEYVVPKYRLEETFDEQDRDEDGDVDYRVYKAEAVVSGFDVVSEDGGTVMSLEFDRTTMDYLYGDGSQSSIEICLWGGKKYIILEGENEMMVYELNSETSRVNKIVSESGMRLFPSIAKRNTTVSVEVAAETQKHGGVLQVISSNGRCVYSKNVESGIEILQIPTRCLESGVYVVAFKTQGKEVETSKLIIR